MKLILLSPDLMLSSAAHGMAQRHGVELVVVPTADAALVACGDDASRLLVVDLRSPGLDIAALMTRLRASAAAQTRVMACGPHVHEASLRAADEAGCDEVVTRGEFDRRLDAALASLNRSP